MSNGQAQVAESTVAPGTERLHYIDWLRVLAMLSIFLFHCDRFFNVEDWHVKNAMTALVSSLHVAFFTHWMMPLFLPRKGTGKSLISRLATLFEKPRAFLLLFLPLAAVDIFIDAAGLGESRATGGWGFLSGMRLKQ